MVKAAEFGEIQYNSHFIDYSKVNKESTKKLADFYFNKAINTIKEYNLDSQGFNETMKKIIEDEKIDTDRLWKLEAESPEKRYVRCIGFEYESKKYIVDSVLQKMFCENDPDYDETSYIINPEEQFYEYYGG